ncbi:MAG: hypothetical protein ACP5KN_09375 [Armatimonadota bacterium]
MPTAARLVLQFERGPCPHCGAPMELEFGRAPEAVNTALVEAACCPECGEEVLAETRRSRLWYTPREFARKDSPAIRLIRCSRQWFALAVELHLAALEVLGADGGELTQRFEEADASLRQALAPALDRARDEIALK